MNITDILPLRSELILTDSEDEAHTFKRFSDGTWEVLMAESWEAYYDKDMEVLYWEYKNQTITPKLHTPPEHYQF